MAYNVKVPEFEGPLDLLLHLIRKNALDIYTISVSQIADQYLAYLEMLQSLNLDRVGDFLVMAATLAYHKSRMLLPTPAEVEEEDDEYESLEELHRRLIEYQRYKEAALDLGSRDRLNRDVFGVHVAWDPNTLPKEVMRIQGSLFDLVSALWGVLKNVPKALVHEVIPERIRTIDRVIEVMEMLLERPSVALEDLIGESPTREILVVTLLSVLELVRMQLIRAYQFEPFGKIQLRLVSGDVDHKKKLKESLLND